MPKRQLLYLRAWALLVVLAIGLAVLAMGASPPVKTNEYEAYPVSCSRSLAVVHVELGLFEYHAFGPVTSCMSADFRSFASTLAPLRLEGVTIQLNSPGGSFTDTLAIVEAMRYLKSAGTRIRVVASGQVRGAALWIFAASDERYIADDAVVYFEYPYSRPSGGVLPFLKKQPDRRHLAWLEPVAGGLGASLDQIEALFDQKALLYGHEVVQRRWAKSTEELEVPVLMLFVPPEPGQAPPEPGR